MEFTESNQIAAAGRVDREAGVIRGVKVIGTSSRNGRTYPPDVLRKAAPLYEESSVNVNHPTRPNMPRVADDRFGRLRSLRYQDGTNAGLVADLHYLKSHPLAERVAESAERGLNAFGLSHNADGEGRQTANGFMVESITRVISVDIVPDPATTRSMFEHDEGLRHIALSELIGNLPDESPAKQVGQQMMQQGGLSPDTQVAEKPEPVAPEVAVKDSFRAEVDRAFDDEALDLDAKVSRIGDIVKAYNEVRETMSSQAKTGEGKGAATTTPEAKPEEKVPAGVAEQIAALTATVGALTEQVKTMATINVERDKVLALLESCQREATPKLVEALIGMKEDARKLFLEELGPSSKPAGSTATKPKTTSAKAPPSGTANVQEGEKPLDRKAVLSGLRQSGTLQEMQTLLN